MTPIGSVLRINVAIIICVAAVVSNNILDYVFVVARATIAITSSFLLYQNIHVTPIGSVLRTNVAKIICVAVVVSNNILNYVFLVFYCYL